MSRRRNGEAGPMTNRYCERAGLTSTPRVEDFVDRTEVNLFHLMVMALLERGGPMTIEEVAQRLTEAGANARSGDMTLSLKKAWHGREPVVRDLDGRMALNLSSPELEWTVWRAQPRPPRFSPSVPPPEPAQPGEDVPLTEDEIAAAFRDRGLFSFAAYRQAAAVLDVLGGPLPLEDVEATLAAMTGYRSPIAAERIQVRHNTLVTLDDDGRLTLDRASSGLGAMRRAVRKLARPVLLREALQEESAQLRAEREAALRVERQRQAEEASLLRRALVHAVPDGEAPRAVAVLDLGARSIETFTADKIGSVPAVLANFDLLVGLHVRETLSHLGADPDGWRLVDLKPPQKSLRINRSGRTLAITPELLISSTTGISRPLGDSARVAAYLAEEASGKLVRRLESDVKALYAFYQYGVLHNSVRLRWGFLDELFPVDWALPGQAHVHEILRTAKEEGAPVELVLGGAPGWAEPWSRARRGHVLDLAPWQVTLRLEDAVWRLDRRDIQAIRIADGAGPA